MKEVSAIMSCSHLPGELRLEHSCTETAGPAVAHQSPPVPHRHSHPPRCYSCTGRSVRWKLEPEMPRGSIRDSTTALFFSALDQRECRWALSAITSKEILKEQRRLQDENKNWVQSNPMPFCYYLSFCHLTLLIKLYCWSLIFFNWTRP